MADEGGGFGWFLAGLGLGALIGVLYAPKSGRETREDILRGAARHSRELDVALATWGDITFNYEPTDVPDAVTTPVAL